jgi:hypothetical protein
MFAFAVLPHDIVMWYGDCAMLNTVIRDGDLLWGKCNVNAMHTCDLVRGMILGSGCLIALSIVGKDTCHGYSLPSAYYNV